jgi:glyceraldehyde 3-phosphate dehydrogenase
MPTRFAINGFGRIGRCIVRAMSERDLKDIQLVAINDLTDAKTLAHLYNYDSVHGRAVHPSHAGEGVIQFGAFQAKITAEKDPTKLPWKELGADVVLECTGLFTDRDKAAGHLAAGAKKVIISAPAKGHDVTVVLGVNQEVYDPTKHSVLSCGSCTTNCLAPVAKVLLDTFGIERGFMTTTHAYTQDQQILDAVHKDYRRARAAAVNVIPTSTGAAKAIGLVIPEMKGKLDGIAMRVPVTDGSATDLVVQVGRDTTKDEVNAAMQAAADTESLTGILKYSTDPLVSSDIIGDSFSSIFDSALTMVNGNLVKVVSWYDNEWGYSCRVVDLVQKVA